MSWNSNRAAGGIGGGGQGSINVTSGAASGTPNTGGGGGGSWTLGGGGGSGVLILRMPTASYSGVHTGTTSVSTDGTFTILKFLTSGTYLG